MNEFENNEVHANFKITLVHHETILPMAVKVLECV